MSKINKLIMAMLAVIITLSVAVAPAGARVRVEISTTAILAIARELVFAAELADVICDVTLHITALTRLINKVSGSLIGRVTAILTANPRSSIGGRPTCAGLTTPPMLVFYGSIEGTLPNITGGTLRVLGGFLISILETILGLIGCLYFGLIEARGENPARRMRVLENSVLEVRDLRFGVVACPDSGELEGEFTLNPTLTVRLLETR